MPRAKKYDLLPLFWPPRDRRPYADISDQGSGLGLGFRGLGVFRGLGFEVAALGV